MFLLLLMMMLMMNVHIYVFRSAPLYARYNIAASNFVAILEIYELTQGMHRYAPAQKNIPFVG